MKKHVQGVRRKTKRALSPKLREFSFKKVRESDAVKRSQKE